VNLRDIPPFVVDGSSFPLWRADRPPSFPGSNVRVIGFFFLRSVPFAFNSGLDVIVFFFPSVSLLIPGLDLKRAGSKMRGLSLLLVRWPRSPKNLPWWPS